MFGLNNTHAPEHAVQVVLRDGREGREGAAVGGGGREAVAQHPGEPQLRWHRVTESVRRDDSLERPGTECVQCMEAFMSCLLQTRRGSTRQLLRTATRQNVQCMLRFSFGAGSVSYYRIQGQRGCGSGSFQQTRRVMSGGNLVRLCWE